MLVEASVPPTVPPVEVPAPPWIDGQTEYGKTYEYQVQGLVKAGAGTAESRLSEAVQITPEDRFPPAVPAGLTAVPSTASIELVWERNTEPDLAGYRVYRSEQEGAKGQSVTRDLLPVPAFRDTSVEPGHRYWYSVTAVDRAGNESLSSVQVAVEVTQPRS